MSLKALGTTAKPVSPDPITPRRLHIGASRLELIARTPTAVTIDSSWLHLGDQPNERSFYEKGTLLSKLKLIVRNVVGSLVPAFAPAPALYQHTTFASWLFCSGSKLEYSEATFSFAYSEHFFEHLRFDIAFELIQEVQRVLVPGGVLRIVVPDADYRTYERPEPVGYPNAKLRFDHPNKHKVRWNVYMLTSVLRMAGFEAVPLVYCDETGRVIERSPSMAHSGWLHLADPEFTASLDYVHRRRSLIVDGVKT
jgi:predicted SAM-dependent methyltransferase